MSELRNDLMRKVAIITRTKNRELLLPRARASVEGQTFKDFVWVLVNDAGERPGVEREAETTRRNGVNVIVLHRDESAGMEAASNDGMSRCTSEYAVIHDDDDTWQPSFLETAVAYLDARPEKLGVVTHSNRIDEEIVGKEVKLLGRSLYNEWVQTIKIADLAYSNTFPPISFLFRRSVYEKLGGFDESLPVLGDWDFNLRCALEGDIGIIPKGLANYHFRVSSPPSAGQYGNTVVAGIDKHIEYEAVYRNRKLREDITENRTGLGFILLQASLQERAKRRLPRPPSYSSAFELIKRMFERGPIKRPFKKS